LPPLSSAVSDAYYVPIPGVSLDADGKPSAIGLGLISLNSSCGALPTPTDYAAGYGDSLGGIIRAQPTDTDPISGQLMSQKYPGGVTLNGYYYAYFSRTAALTCAATNTFQSMNSAFTIAVDNMKPDSASN
jgi:hypothetical protein